MTIGELFDRFVRIRKCGGCREILKYENLNDALCPECAQRWRIAKTESCPTCMQSAPDCRCMPKPLSKAGAILLRKLFFYRVGKENEAQNRLLYFLKRHSNKRMTAFVAEELYRGIEAELAVLGATPENTLIVNVPRAHHSRRVYGFDQAEYMAKILSELSGIPCAAAIKRRRGSKEQKRLDVRQRFRNADESFTVKGPSTVEGRYVIIYDDVVTTGASMSACTKALTKAGAKGVLCVCMAQAAKNNVK